MDEPDHQTPSRSKIVYAAIGALVSATAIGVALYYGPPSARAPRGEAPAGKVPETSERPIVRAVGLDGPPMLQTRWLPSGPLHVTDVETQTVHTVQAPSSLRKFWGRTPIWIHVAASWCLPCLWELEPYFAAVSRLRDTDVQPVIAIIDGDGDPKAGFEQLLRKHKEILGERGVRVPPSLHAVADDGFSLAGFMDRMASRDRAAFRTKGIPLSFIFDRCGGLRAVVQNRHGADSFGFLEETSRKLASRTSPCP